MLTGVLGRTGLAGVPKPVAGADAAALRFGDRSREGAGAGPLVHGSEAGAAHVGVHTHAAIRAHRQPPRALAVEGALGVGAVAIHADAWRLALVHVWEEWDPLGPAPSSLTSPSHLPRPSLPLSPPFSLSLLRLHPPLFLFTLWRSEPSLQPHPRSSGHQVPAGSQVCRDT